MDNVTSGRAERCSFGPAMFKDPVPISIKDCSGILKKIGSRILNFRIIMASDTVTGREFGAVLCTVLLTATF